MDTLLDKDRPEKNLALDYSKNTIQKIAVILPEYFPYGGVFRSFKNILKMLALGSRLSGKKIEIVACFPEGFYDSETAFKDLLEYNISLRECVLCILQKKEVLSIVEVQHKKNITLEHAKYCIFDDGANYLLDCDSWFLVTDKTCYPLAPLRPYGLFVHDHLQRYLPELLSKEGDSMGFLYTARAAKFVMYATPFAGDSLVQYVGVNPRNTVLMPLEVDLRTDQPLGISITSDAAYFLWNTNGARHKYQINALRALLQYYVVHQGALQVVIAGVGTNLWNPAEESSFPDEFLLEVRTFIQKNTILENKIIFAGELSEENYMNTLARAKFLWCPTLVEAGAFFAVEAAVRGVPTLAHDYSPMRFYEEYFSLNMMFFNIQDPDNAAKTLKYMELHSAERAKILPTIEYLQQYAWQELASSFLVKFIGFMRKFI